MIDIDSDTESDTESDTVDEQDERRSKTYHDRVNLLARALAVATGAPSGGPPRPGRRRRVPIVWIETPMGQTSWQVPVDLADRSGRCNEQRLPAATRANRRTTCWRRGPKRVSVLVTRRPISRRLVPTTTCSVSTCSRRDCSTTSPATSRRRSRSGAPGTWNREHGDSFHIDRGVRHDRARRSPGPRQRMRAVTRIPTYAHRVRCAGADRRG